MLLLQQVQGAGSVLDMGDCSRFLGLLHVQTPCPDSIPCTFAQQDLRYQETLNNILQKHHKKDQHIEMKKQRLQEERELRCFPSALSQPPRRNE